MSFETLKKMLVLWMCWWIATCKYEQRSKIASMQERSTTPTAYAPYGVQRSAH